MSNNRVPSPEEVELIVSLVLDVPNQELREHALSELCKKRDTCKELPLLLWHSFGTITVLLQEILVVCDAVRFSATLSSSALSRACHALALFQTVASHPETRILFVRAEIPPYFYSFLDCANKGKAFESLRVTSLGVLGALVKVHDAEVIHFLLRTEVIPPCLQVMEMGSDLSKIVATFIVENILLTDAGLMFACATVDRFFDLSNVLATMIAALIEEPSTKLLKHVIRCYLRLTYDSRALAALRISFPEALKDGTFNNCLREDAEAVQWLQQLLDRLRRRGPNPAQGSRSASPAQGGSASGAAPPPVPVGAFARNGVWKWV